MKKEKEKTPTSKGTAVLMFLKKNVYIILMIVCILAIATMITVAAVMNNKKDIDGPIVNLPPEDNKPVDKPDDPNKPVDKPEEPVIKPFEFMLRSPVASVKYGNGYSDEIMVSYPNIKVIGTHNGLDIMVAAGSKVVNGLEGKVIKVETDSIYMTTVVIEHKEGYQTVYRLLENVTLKVGDNVATNAEIGVVSGDINHFEGDSETHLHLEVMKNGDYLNPQDYLMEGDK